MNLLRRLWRSPYFGLALLTAALSGCATTQPAEPRIVIQEKVVPVKTPCVSSNVAPAPTYPDTDEALKTAGSPERRYQMIIAGRDLRDARLGVVEPVIESCRK
jgi:hypothetical protein